MEAVGNTAFIQLSFVLRGVYQLLFSGDMEDCGDDQSGGSGPVSGAAPAGGTAAFDCQD